MTFIRQPVENFPQICRFDYDLNAKICRFDSRQYVGLTMTS